ncbi:phosphoribosylformylglycinamidine synthase subunit PurS [Seleniivibrio woodruffii]|uniref:Phosphoribosylformylglycinamidine synthase subunit PurS n=1 Tax=Seleniivibrio woodruffii TaxID=1078050 RepID=A0A4R1K3D2_9BACT|nr:phosphoribosylformylglycinamidine synthase subunit PurS [Seleniivibrio woodruffii]TCK58367.1 phosphoribosylformylglycinamidine synthase [Seleniivibrio woodruffii]TVZ36741.1 phosphoribosylformylglycinamidine synthase [Seleniivibrio woodruffii]
MKAKVYVRLKNGVLDPQGQTIQSSVERMGYDFAKEVRVGKVFEIEVESEACRKDLEKIASTMLANMIIEEYSIEFEA